MSSLKMLKAGLRKLFLQKRKELTALELETSNKKIAELFFTFLPPAVFTVHIYLPILGKNEIDTWPVIHRLWELGINTVVPVMDRETYTLQSYLLTPETKLAENEWQIPEPVNSAFVEHQVIDLVVMPLLSFDYQGYRVGYGKGYYDKFLASFGHQPIKVGLSFFDPVPEIADRNDADVPMDYCITPEKVFRF
jgi:5-formyltetrahydrofolate cyclo-ligase